MPRWSPWDRRVRGTAEDQFEAVAWGLEPRQHVPVVAPQMARSQKLVALGRGCKLRALFFEGDLVLRPIKPYPWLCFGARDNRLYIVGGCADAMARRQLWGPVGHSWTVERVDYQSTKGDDGSIYYFHDFEEPFPRLVILPNGWPQFRGGGYRVEAAGIVG